MSTLINPTNLPRGFVYAESEPELIHTTRVITNNGVNSIVADNERCGSCWYKNTSFNFKCSTIHDPDAIAYQSCHLFNKRLDNVEKPLRCNECLQAEEQFKKYGKLAE